MDSTSLPFDERSVHHGEAHLSEVRLHYVEAGEGPMVVLLHGFPEFWYAWRHQIPALAAAGYRVVAPDMRGYDLSEKPPGVSSYSWPHLVRDVRELVEVLGETRASIVGHDWGAVVAWWVASQEPEVVERLGILNVPHPQRMLQGLRTLAQLRKSWYILFFQLPWLPEWMLGAADFAGLRRMLRRDPCRPGAFPEADIERYVEALSRPGCPTAPIHYYRAALRDLLLGRGPEPSPIHCPVLVIWGEQDRHLGSELAEPPARLVPDCRLVRLPDASHWVQADRPERVNQLLLEFLGE